MIIAIIFILAGIAFMIVTLVYVRNKNSLQEIRKFDTKDTRKLRKNICSLWGISNIKDNLIEVNKRQYSMILELNSISYELLHEQEKNTVDSELISISQMIKFPFQFLMIKQGINTKTSIEKIETSIVSANSYIKRYGQNLIEHLERISSDKNLVNRKYYMIISSFNKEKEAKKELLEFYDTLRYHLININVGIRTLTRDEAIQLIYNQLHKGSKTKVNEIIAKGGLELYATQD